MIYNGAAVREKLAALRDAMTAARDRTELDPFDDAMFSAVHYMLDLSDRHSTAIERLAKANRKIERKLR